MRTYLQSKSMAKTLREALAEKNIDLSHSDCLEIVARQFGFGDWNTLAAKLRIKPGSTELPQSGVVLALPIPILQIASLGAAKEFYVDFLGFQIDWGDEEPPAERAYAQVSRDGVQLHLAEASEGGQSASLLFRGVQGLTEFHRELNARRGKFAPSPLRFTPWDSREFHVTDPFGNHLRFWENNPPGIAR